MTNLIIQQNGVNRVVWVNPLNLGSTTTADVRRNSKKIGPYSVHQINSLVATNRAVAYNPSPDCEDACVVPPKEDIAIRTTISGSAENADAIALALTDHIANLNTLFSGSGLRLGIIKRDATLTEA